MKRLTPKQMQYRKSLLTKIHLAPLYKQMDEETYRAMLETHFGKRSAGSLSLNQLILLLDYLNGKCHHMTEHATRAQIQHIKTSWQAKAYDPSDNALYTFINNNFGKTIIGLNALTKQEAGGVINAINRMTVRHPQS